MWAEPGAPARLNFQPREPGSRWGLSHAPVGIRGDVVHRPQKAGGDAFSISLPASSCQALPSREFVAS